MERTMRNSSKEKQTPIGREEFRRQQDVKREEYRRELQKQNGRKRITIGSVLTALWVTPFVLLVLCILASMFLADF